MSRLYYLNDDSKPDMIQSEHTSMFSRHRLQFNEKFELCVPENYSFIFLLSGSLRMTGNNLDEIIEEGCIYSLGYQAFITLQSLSDTTFLLLTFDDCAIYSYKGELFALEQYISDDLPLIPSLPITHPAQHLVDSIMLYLDNKMHNRNLYQLKLGEWLFLVFSLYSKQQNATFFHPLLRQQGSFELLVRDKAQNVNTVNDLAEACHMTPKTLTRKFKVVFDTTPKQWLLQQKKEQVMTAFQQSRNRKDLPGKLGFSSYYHLNYFCISQFGKSLKDLC